jgi:hypothetical protein
MNTSTAEEYCFNSQYKSLESSVCHRCLQKDFSLIFVELEFYSTRHIQIRLSNGRIHVCDAAI